MKTALEEALMLFVYFVIAAGAYLIAMLCIPFGLGFIFMEIGKELFGVGIISNLGFVAGIVLGYMFVFYRIIAIDDSPAPPASPVPRAPPAPENKEKDWSWTFIGATGLFVFFYFKAIEKLVPPPVPPPAQVQQEVLVPLNQPMPTVKPTGTRKHRNNSDLRHCLNLPTNAEIIRCANQGQ